MGNDFVQRHHHVTSCVGGAAQQDHDFHTKVLGLNSVKKTLLYDGQVPIYHLYYGNDSGDESTLLTTFCVEKLGRKAKKGTGQFSTMDVSIPVSGVEYWQARLRDHGFEVGRGERFGETRLRVAHPGGIDYELVTVADDARRPSTNGGVAPEMGIRGSHGITLPVRDLEHQDEFLQLGWGARKVATDGRYTRYEVGAGGSGSYVDVHLEPDTKGGDWMLGQGMFHHCAFQVADFDAQDGLKALLEGLGFTDVSERKDRGYFYSIYVRSPSGALFEATVTKPGAFTIDEPLSSLGQNVMIAPQFADRRAEILAQMDPIRD